MIRRRKRVEPALQPDTILLQDLAPTRRIVGGGGKLLFGESQIEDPRPLVPLESEQGESEDSA